MSFFYDLNKKLDSIRATPEVTHQQLNERDLGKHNNATTGFKALAAKTNDKIAGAQLAKMRDKGQVEEGSIVDGVWTADPPKKGQPNVPAPSDPDGGILNKKTPPPAAAASRAAPPAKKTTNEGGVVDPVGEIRPGQRSPVRPSYKPEVKRITPLPKPSGATDDEIDESALQAAFGIKKYTKPGMEKLQQLGREGASEKTKAAARKRFNQYDESMTDEGNAFSGAVVKAKRDGIQPGEKINVGGKEYPVKEAAKYRDPKYKDKLYTQEPLDHTFGPDMDAAYYNDYPDDYAGRKQPMASGNGDPLRKGFGRGGAANSINTRGPRKGLPSRDQITGLKGSIKDASGTHAPAKFADKVGRAKKEVDEMLGQVAADAMKKAVGGGRGRNAEMDEGFMDDTPTSRKSNTSGRVDTSKTGSTVHYAGKNYSGAGHDASADDNDETSGQIGRRKVGAGMGTKIGAKINRGTSKLMTKEGDQDPADQGEYGREGEMGRNEIHTMMRNAKQLEKMLGNDDDLPEWVQKKLSLASDYMQTIADYLASEKETDAEDQTGREVEVELAEKKAPSKKASQAKSNDGNLANNAKPYDKVTRGDVVAGRLGKDEMGGKSKPSKPKAKSEEEVEESTTAGSVATAPTSGKSGGGMSFGKGIYDSINRAVEKQINESMNISMNMSNDEHGGPRQTLTITATDEDASQLATLLKMAGLGGGEAETCDTCGMSDCGCGDMEQMYEAKPGMGAAVRGASELGSAAAKKFGSGVERFFSQLSKSSGHDVAAIRNAFANNAAKKAASDAAADAHTAANGEANFQKLLAKTKTTQLPYMGPPKDIEDPAASAFKSYFEPGTATPTNRIPTIDKPPQMRRSTDRPAFDQSVRQTAVRDPFDPLVDESYGDNVVDMNSPNYPTNTEQAENNFGYSGGLNKEKRDVAGNGQSTVPVTAVREQDDDELSRIKEMAGILTDPRDVMRYVAGPSLVSQLPKPDGGNSANRTSSYKNTFLDPAQKAQQKMARQNESIFTDTANLWKSYKG